MPEQIVVFHWDDFETPVHVDRNKLYENRWMKDYKDYFVFVVDAFIFNNDGKLLFQKRGKWKKHGSGKLHTSVWWHVNPGENHLFTLTHETIEEIGAPCTIIPEDQIYKDALKKLLPYSDKFAIMEFQNIYRRDINKFKDRAWRVINAKDKAAVFFGIYNWPVESIDKSSDGFEYFSLDELEDAMQENPEQFTSIFHHYYKVFKDELRAFANKYCKNI